MRKASVLTLLLISINFLLANNSINVSISNSDNPVCINPPVPPPPPSNNGPCSATPLTVELECMPTMGTTLAATASSVDDPGCGWGYNGGDVWYSAIVPASGFMQVSLMPGGLTDGGIAVYSGSGCNDLTEEACSENTGNIPAPVVITPANGLQGEFVWIRVWEGSNNSPGSFEICLVDQPVLFADPDTYTPQQLIEEVLITGCLQAENVVYDGDPSAIAYFEGGLTAFGMASGVVMGSGAPVNLTGQGTDGVDYETGQSDVESDLSAISVLNGGSANMHDECIIEFDFIPSSEVTEFEFVFASKEYPTYEHTSFNDVFAFFVSGPGIDGDYADDAINIALVPGTDDPITISTVNGTDNPSYFAGYTAGSPIPNFDVGGYTIPITAVMEDLIPCETYHIKFAISDAGDGSLSSYVFFEESSFSSGGDVTMSGFSDIGEEHDIYEGCENYYVFDRIDTSAAGMQDTAWIYLDYSGTAIPGVDYTPMPDTLFIVPGEYEYILNYTAFFDNINEGNETIIFSLLNGCPCSLVPSNDTIIIIDNYNLNATISDPELICFGDSSVITTTVNPDIDPLLITYHWSNDLTTSDITVTPLESSNYFVTVTNICQINHSLTTNIQVVPDINPSFALSKTTACVGEPINIIFTGSTTPLATFEWNFEGANEPTSNVQNPAPSVWSTGGDKTITLSINDQGCLAEFSASINVIEYSDMNLSTSNTPSLCYGDCNGTGTVTANIGVSPFSFIWNDGQTEQTAENLCPGTYNVTVSDYYGCKDTTHLSVSQPTEMVYSYNKVDATCFGYFDGSASVSVSGGVPPYQYLWSDLTTGNSITNLSSENYSVTITDSKGCQKVEPNIFIEQPTQVNTSISGDYLTEDGQWICIGETATLTSSATGGVGPYTFMWNSGHDSPVLEVSPQTTETYSAIATDATGCQSLISEIQINVYDPISINSFANPMEICTGELVDINIEATGGNGNYTYNISSSSIDQSSAFSIAPIITQSHIITVSDNCNSPVDMDTFNITVNPLPQVAFSSDITEGCVPLVVEFEDLSSEINNTYKWEFINQNFDANIALEQNPTFVFNNPGSYHVKLSVTSEYNCESEFSNFDYITAFPTAEAMFHPEPEITSLVNPIISFINESTGADLYQWTFGDNDTSLNYNPQHTFPEQVSNYYVELIASNQFGCADTTGTEIQIVDEITFYPPTAFTPDGDNNNEIFYIKSSGMSSEDYNLIIYDRWGMEVFNSTDINVGWNGTKKGSKVLDAGVYTWVLKYKDIYDIPHEENGVVTLIR